LKSQLWPFDDPEKVAAITKCEIMDRVRPVLYVSHEEDARIRQRLRLSARSLHQGQRSR
jgi:hypothetical protein